MQKKYRWILSFLLLVGSSTALADNVNEKQELNNARTQLDSALEAIQEATSVKGQAVDWTPFNDALEAAKNQNYKAASDLLAPELQKNSSSNSSEQNQIYKAVWGLAKLIGIIEPSLDPLPTIRAGLARRVHAINLFDEIYKIKDDQNPTLVVVSSQDTRCGYCITADKALTKFARESKRSGKKYNILYVGSEPYTEGTKEPTQSLHAFGVKGYPMYSVIYKGEYIYSWEGLNDKQFQYLLNNIEELKKGAGRRKLVYSMPDTLLDYTHSKYGAYAGRTSEFKAMSFAMARNALQLHYAYESQDQESANQSALNQCENNPVVLRNGIACELYAEGNNVVSTKAIERFKNKEVQIREDREAQAIALAEASKQKLKANTSTNNTSTNKGNDTAVALSSAKKTSPKKQQQQSTINDADLKNALNKYKNTKENFKSFASTGTDANSAFGAAIKAPTQGVANTRALNQCQQFAEALATDQRCLLSYIGDTEVIDNDEESIAKLTLKVQRKSIKKSPLKSSYSKYRRLSEDKAYAFSHDDNDTFAYAMAFGKRGIDKASEIALEQCEEKRQQKSLERPCRLLIINGDFQE